MIHEYQITSLSLTAAIANGISVEQIIKVSDAVAWFGLGVSFGVRVGFGKASGSVVLGSH